MQLFGKVPFLRLLISYLAGLILASYFDPGFTIPTWHFAGILILLFLMLKVFRMSYRFRWVSGCLVNVFLFFFGCEWMSENTVSYEDYTDCFGYKECIVLIVNDKPGFKGKFIKCRASVEVCDSTRPVRKMNTILYIENDSLNIPKYGDRIVCRGSIREVNPPSNPGEFDYRKFLLNKGVAGQIWLRAPYWMLFECKDKGVFSRIYTLSAVLNERISRVFDNNEDLMVAGAMLTGDNSNFDDELRNRYSGVGAMHILCVSGLHVGIIFLLLNSMLAFLNKNHIGRILKSCTLLICIWIYAAITGLSPSVLRASTMFSFIIVGMLLHEKSNIYNSLFASAFLLLVIDPKIMYSLGFQLSYLAVLAIVSIQPILYNMFEMGNYLLDKAWAIITVSIAAQIGTAPLAIMYFHQFPNYFILTNLIVIPLSAVILYSGFVYLSLSGWKMLSYVPSEILYYSVKFLNFSTKLIYNFPYPVSRDLSLSPQELLLLYLIVTLVLFYIYSRMKKFFFAALLSLIILISSSTLQRYFHLNRREVVEYNIKGNIVKDFVSGYDHVLVGDSIVVYDSAKVDYYIRGNWIEESLDNPLIVFIK